MSLPPPPKVQKLQEALHAKAKTAMWELAGHAKRERGTYVPYSAKLAVCSVVDTCAGSGQGTTSVTYGSRLAILVYQGSDPTQPYPTLVIRQSATLSLRLHAMRLDDVVRPLAWIGAT